MVDLDKNRIIFTDKFSASMIDTLLECVEDCVSTGHDSVLLDFEFSTGARPDSMIPLLATVDWLRNSGRMVSAVLPRDPSLQRLFLQSSWAHHLDPSRFPSSTDSQHFMARRFRDSEEQQRVVNDFMRVVVGTLNLPPDVLSGFEWSINEITDNVLMHSESPSGGLAQIISLSTPSEILFCVADAGRGILASMREGHPRLQSDSAAIEAAMMTGVTRNEAIGQGNGLAGTRRIASLAGGRFNANSFHGRCSVGQEHKSTTTATAPFRGTMVTASMQPLSSFRIEEALEFAGRRYSPGSILDNCEHEKNSSVLRLANESKGIAARSAGAYIRKKAMHLLSTDSSGTLVIDWSGVSVASSSFADEALGKLFMEIGPLAFATRIKHRNLSALNAALVDKAILSRAARYAATESLDADLPTDPRNRSED
jgi:hypothetical protein